MQAWNQEGVQRVSLEARSASQVCPRSGPCLTFSTAKVVMAAPDSLLGSIQTLSRRCRVCEGVVVSA